MSVQQCLSHMALGLQECVCIAYLSSKHLTVEKMVIISAAYKDHTVCSGVSLSVIYIFCIVLANNSHLKSLIVHSVTRPENVLDKTPARLKNNFDIKYCYIFAVCLTRVSLRSRGLLVSVAGLLGFIIDLY